MAENHEIIRAMIHRENELVNHRFTWFTAFQGLLFAALAFAWKDGKELVPAFCLLGIMVAILSAISLVFATVSINRLLSWWLEHKPKPYDGPPVWGPVGDEPARIWGHVTPWNLVTVLFLVGWMVILRINVHR